MKFGIMKRQLSKNIISNILQVLISTILMFVLYRYLSKKLGVEDLGVWAVVMAIASASRIADLGMTVSITKFVASSIAKKQLEEAGEIVETGVITFIIAVPVLLLILYPVIIWGIEIIFIKNGLSKAMEILPFAILTFYLTMITSIMQSGLDGCQKMGIKASIIIIIQILYVLIALILVDSYGLNGLVWAQVVQGILLVIINWYFLRLTFVKNSIVPIRWKKELFIKILKYGSNIQIGSLMMIFFDPLTKGLLAKYGGLSAAGYFEIANQVVSKARSLIIVANQAIVPKISQMSETSEGKIADIYIINMRLLILSIMPIFGLMIMLSGVFSNIFLGIYEEQFILFFNISAIAWGINTMSGAAYFVNIGTGKVSMNTIGNILMGFFNGFIGWKMGEVYGAKGVILTYSTALMVGSVFLIWRFHVTNNIKLRDICIKDFKKLSIACILLSQLGFISQNLNISFFYIVPSAVFLVLYIFYLIWINPLKNTVFN